MSEQRPHRTHPTRKHRRRGLTLAELVISSVSTMVLIGGLTSAIFVASRAAETDQTATVATFVGLTLDEIATELRTAKAIIGKSADSITFTVDDRSTDSGTVDETIKYSWDDTTDTLTRIYNNVSSTVLTDIHSFALAYTVQPASSNKRILFLQGDVVGTDATYDNFRVQKMEDWGFTVIRKTIVAATTESELETAASTVDAIYVSTTVVHSNLGTKLKSTSKGVILEELRAAEAFELTGEQSAQYTSNSIKIADNTHYITSTFNSGPLSIATTSVPLQKLDSDIAAGMKVYGKTETGSSVTLAIADTGALLDDNTQSEGPRICVPWGGDGINPANLSADGLTLWRRSLDWITGTQVLTSIDLSVQVASSEGPVIQTRAEMIGRPRP
jgi:hypothetical protein